ncbi:MAG: transposase domain-containing protein [bacterium]
MSGVEIIKNNPVWIDENQASSLLGLKIETLRKNCATGKYIFEKMKNNGEKVEYRILLSCLPERFQNKYHQFNSTNETTFDLDIDIMLYNKAPNWAKKQADKYIVILTNSRGLKGRELRKFVEEWNCQNPDFKTSYSAINESRLRYENGGTSALLAQYGKTAGASKIEDKYFEYFKNLYLVEGAPSVYSCWLITLGYAMREEGLTKEQFPKHLSFKRRLEREIPTSSIYLARYGYSKWNKKFANYVERDYSAIRCGSVWVADHAQIDIACENLDGKVSYPWVTAWRCFKSGKWLGWILQPNNPNSDHIFQSFYYSASEYGIPDDVIIDNGRDFRAKDFAGGRKYIKINADEPSTTAMLGKLGVIPHFALPYNAQTKPIERDFLKIKELLSKHAVGYRGGNVTERPEKLKKEIAQGKILKFEEFKEIFDDFIVNVFNKMNSNGKNHKGKSPDELFALEFTEKRVVSKDALILFCKRTSRELTITQNGVRDSELEITYWADWMLGVKGEKAYLRRDAKNYNEAWIFKASNDELLGTAYVKELAPALAKEPVSKDRFKEFICDKKRGRKIEKAYSQNEEVELNEKILNYKTVLGDKEYLLNPKINKIANTAMDKAVRKQKNNEKIGTHDLSIFLEEPQKEQKLYLFESDREIEKAEQEYLTNYGY